MNAALPTVFLDSTEKNREWYFKIGTQPECVAQTPGRNSFARVHIIVLQRRDQNCLLIFHQQMSEGDGVESVKGMRAQEILRLKRAGQTSKIADCKSNRAVAGNSRIAVTN
jgi:hypothetical protein